MEDHSVLLLVVDWEMSCGRSFCAIAGGWLGDVMWKIILCYCWWLTERCHVEDHSVLLLLVDWEISCGRSFCAIVVG